MHSVNEHGKQCDLNVGENATPGAQNCLTASSESQELSQILVYFTWRISGIPHLNVSWQYVGVPDAKCPAVMWSHLT